MQARWYWDVAGILAAFVAVLLLARLLPPVARAVVIVGAGGVTLALLALVPRWWTDSGQPVDDVAL